MFLAEKFGQSYFGERWGGKRMTLRIGEGGSVHVRR